MMKKMVLALLLSAGSVYGQVFNSIEFYHPEGIEEMYIPVTTDLETISTLVNTLYSQAASVSQEKPEQFTEDELSSTILTLRENELGVEACIIKYYPLDLYPLIILYDLE